jgi:hypothetical protein
MGRHQLTQTWLIETGRLLNDDFLQLKAFRARRARDRRIQSYFLIIARLPCALQDLVAMFVI